MIDPAFWGVIPKNFGSATKQLSSDQFTLVIGYIGMSAKGFDRWNHKQTNRLQGISFFDYEISGFGKWVPGFSLWNIVINPTKITKGSTGNPPKKTPTVY